jgi:hypothetical protein
VSAAGHVQVAAAATHVPEVGLGVLACFETAARGGGPLWRSSGDEAEGNGAGLVGTLDNHGFSARTSVGARATDDGRDLAWRRRVEELNRDLTV